MATSCFGHDPALAIILQRREKPWPLWKGAWNRMLKHSSGVRAGYGVELGQLFSHAISMHMLRWVHLDVSGFLFLCFFFFSFGIPDEHLLFSSFSEHEIAISDL